MALFILACTGLGKDVTAAEWVLKGSLDQQLQYNDNISLSTIRKESVVGYLLAPSLQAARKTGVLDIVFDGRGDIRRYDDSRWDCDNYNLGLNNSYRAKRSTFNLSGGYSVSCSYSQQITDTGLLVPQSQFETYQLTPSWTWQWTPRDQLIASASYSKISYSNSQGSIAASGNGSLNFSDYDTYTVSLSEKHAWSRRLSLNGKVYFSNIQYTELNAPTQNLFSLQLSADYIINHYWAVKAGGGPIWVEGNRQGQNSSSLGPVANISLNYNDKLNQFSIGYSSAVNPSAIGQTLQTESVFANYSYRLTRHLSLSLISSYTNSQSIGDQSSGNFSSQFDRSYFTASAAIVWELAKSWKLQGSYVHSRQDYQQDNNVQNLNIGTSNSNAVMLSLNYSWDDSRTHH